MDEPMEAYTVMEEIIYSLIAEATDFYLDLCDCDDEE